MYHMLIFMKISNIVKDILVQARAGSVVKAELLFGARNSERVNDNLKLLDRFFAAFRSLPFDDTAAEQYGIIRDVGEFSRIIGLNVEDWVS